MLFNRKVPTDEVVLNLLKQIVGSSCRNKTFQVTAFCINLVLILMFSAFIPFLDGSLGAAAVG